MKKEDKVIKNEKVAVAISPGFGAGWTTWNGNKISPFNPKIIEMIEKGKQSEITEEWCKENLGIKGHICCLGTGDLIIEWLPVGTKFSINEYDGSESIYRDDELEFVAQPPKQVLLNLT